MKRHGAVQHEPISLPRALRFTLYLFPHRQVHMEALRVWLGACALSSLSLCLLGEPPCRTAHSLSGMALVGHAYRHFASASPERCVFACEADPACLSINYYTRASLCELNSITKHWFPAHVVAAQGALYVESVARGFNPASCEEDATLLGRCGCLRGHVSHLCEHGKVLC